MHLVVWTAKDVDTDDLVGIYLNGSSTTIEHSQIDMEGTLIIKGNNKEELYENLFPQIKSLIEDEDDAIANMANISACLYETFRFWWVGFYRVVGKELVLGPFQGPVACTRIRKGRGVCGSTWEQEHTIIVPDVNEFPGHIACSSASRSEIVVPVYSNGTIVAVLDIDSEHKATFDHTDQIWLERIVALLEPYSFQHSKQ